MKKAVLAFIATTIILFATCAWADPPSATFTWVPPTQGTKIDDCSTIVRDLTQEEIDLLGYTISYRVKGTTEWIHNKECTGPPCTIEDLEWDTTYQAVMGAHHPGKLVICPTGIVEFKTGKEPVAAGPCSGVAVEVDNGD